MKYAIEVKNVKKSYGNFEAVSGISFNIKQGMCFGVLGPNGAGKTTLLGMMEGITPFDQGSIEILNMDIKKQLRLIQPRVGIQLQSNNYFKFLSVRQLLKLYSELKQASLKKAEKNDRDTFESISELLEMLSLSDKADMKISELSGGQAQRFSIAVAMLGDPEIIFLDEPTSALDPQNRRYIWDFIERTKKDKNKTIMLTTHYMEEAETLCDELIIMDHGKIISQGAPSELVRSLNKHKSIYIKYKNGQFTEEILNNCSSIVGYKHELDGLNIQSEDSVDTIMKLIEFAKTNLIDITELDVKLPNLEDVFINKTGGALRDE